MRLFGSLAVLALVSFFFIPLTRAADVFTNATVTRAADVASINTLNPWYNATEGTVFAQFQAVNATDPTSQQPIWSFDNGTSNEVVYATRTATSNRFRYNSRSSGVIDADVSIPSPTIADGALAKTVVAIATNNDISALNGTLSTADTSVVVPTVNRMTLGSYRFTTFNLNGYLQKVIYYPKRLTNSELQALTS